MKKAKPVPPRSGAKSGDGAKAVDEYLAALPEPARSSLSKIRATVRSIVPAEATEGISYGMPTFKYKGPVIGYAAFKNHCSLFVLSGTALAAFQNELKDYTVSKGTIRFPMDKPLPAALVKKLVKARLARNELKSKR